jgi:hypothetical protein
MSGDKEPYQVAITHAPNGSGNTFCDVNQTPKVISKKVFDLEGRWFG